MNKALMALAAAFALSACGKAGPYRFDITTTQKFELANGSAVVSFEPGKTLQGVASFSPLGKKLELEVGGQKFVFKGANARP
jgi:hypothetical protein